MSKSKLKFNDYLLMLEADLVTDKGTEDDPFVNPETEQTTSTVAINTVDDLINDMRNRCDRNGVFELLENIVRSYSPEKFKQLVSMYQKTTSIDQLIKTDYKKWITFDPRILNIEVQGFGKSEMLLLMALKGAKSMGTLHGDLEFNNKLYEVKKITNTKSDDIKLAKLGKIEGTDVWENFNEVSRIIEEMDETLIENEKIKVFHKAVMKVVNGTANSIPGASMEELYKTLKELYKDKEINQDLEQSVVIIKSLASNTETKFMIRNDQVENLMANSTSTVELGTDDKMTVANAELYACKWLVNDNQLINDIKKQLRDYADSFGSNFDGMLIVNERGGTISYCTKEEIPNKLYLTRISNGDMKFAYKFESGEQNKNEYIRAQ